MTLFKKSIECYALLYLSKVRLKCLFCIFHSFQNMCFWSQDFHCFADKDDSIITTKAHKRTPARLARLAIGVHQSSKESKAGVVTNTDALQILTRQYL